MKINQQIASDVKERLLAMFTYDCASFMNFRGVLEGEHSDEVAVRLEVFLSNLDNLLKHCGATTTKESGN